MHLKGRPSGRWEAVAGSETTVTVTGSYVAPLHCHARPIRLGTDFSGLDVIAVSLQRLGVPYEHCFSSDVDPHVRALIRHQHKPNVLFEDVVSRDTDAAPEVDLYAFGPPCQSFSTAGKQAGTADTRGQLFMYGLDYVVRKRPRLVLFENVPGVKGKHKEVSVVLETVMTQAGYIVDWRILNTSAYGVPHRRERFYLVAVLASCQAYPFQFPAQLQCSPRMQDFVAPAATWNPMPQDGGAATKVMTEYEKWAAKGTNPFTTPVCVDTACSKNWVTSSAGTVVTLTKSHCQSFSHWLSTKGAHLTVDDYMRLQGMQADSIDWQGAGVTQGRFAGMLGNAMSGNVLDFLLPGALRAAGLVSTDKFEQMFQASLARWGQ